jgi:hypothetical protein
MTPEERVVALGEDLRTVAVSYCDALLDVERCATRLANLEGRLCAAQYRVGIYHDVRPPARELAAEIANGHLQALRPYVPLVVNEAMQRAEEALVGPKTLPSECRQGTGECPIGGLCDPTCGLIWPDAPQATP